MAYEPGHHHHTDLAGSGHLEAQGLRPREQSHARAVNDHTRYDPTRKVDEAITTAFDQEISSNVIDPDLVAKITQNVILQLHQSGGLDTSTPVPSRDRFSPPQPVVHQPIPLSPSTASGASPNMPGRVFTPPSPQKHSDYPGHTSPPHHTQSDHRADGPQSPHEHRNSHYSPPRRSPSPQSHTSDSSDRTYARPKGPSRLSTSKEETTLEKIWGQLFDEDSHPTVRLGQFLRGLAVHLIEDYEPKHSLVITPNKMVKYYEDVKLSHELYPWSIVFDDEHSSISRMYRDLECSHHLVQERYDDRPDIPGLTPIGFERWVTLLIQAHPELEFERLQKTVLEMPISNPDDKKERFPKEISRRLFPGHEDRRIRDRIEDAISKHAAVDLPRRPDGEESHTQSQPDTSPVRTANYDLPNHKAFTADSIPQKASTAEQNYAPHRPSVSFDLPPSSGPSIERERKPYSNIPTDSAIDDTNPPMPPPSNPISIERERKPYSAAPGGSKNYEDESRRESTRPRSESVAAPIPKPSRSDSSARSRPIPINATRPMEIPKPELHHHRAPSNAGRRRRSPSFSRGTTNDFRRSESDIKGYQPNSYQPSASVPGGIPPPEPVFDESETRKYFEKNARDRAERARRQADDDARNYGESPRRHDAPAPRRVDYMSDEDYHRAGGRSNGNGYDYAQPHGGYVYR